MTLDKLKEECTRAMVRLNVDFTDLDQVHKYAAMFYCGYYADKGEVVPPIVLINMMCGRMDRLVNIPETTEERLQGITTEEIDKYIKDL